MPIFALGLSHKTAPVEMRENLSFSQAELEKILSDLKPEPALKELTVLSTCNRTEIYCHSDAEPKSWCAQFLRRKFGREDLERYLYPLEELQAVNHLFKVAAGLDSLVFGEQEILKQVKDAYSLAQKAGWTGKCFNVLFQRALYVGKLVRTSTGIAQGALSVGSVAIALAEKIFGGLEKSTVLILGAGQMAEVCARYLLSKKVKRLIVANRTAEHARALAEQFNAEARNLEEGLEEMLHADVVIASTSAAEPILTKPFMHALMQRRQNRSLFVIDIAVPRNADPEIHKLDNVYLYNIDDLEAIAHDNLQSRAQEIEKATRLVEEKSREFFDWLLSVRSGSEKSLKHGRAPDPDLPMESNGRT